MSESPYNDLPSKEFLEQLDKGELFVFQGERFTIPGDLPNHLQGHSGRLFEVSADKLVSVAQHLSNDHEKSGQTISRAYKLICEAEVFSRNLTHWNDKAQRHHIAKSIHEIVSENEITSGKDLGKVPRLKLLSAFLKATERPSNPTDAGKIFNRWIHESLRLKDYSREIPWNPSCENYDEQLSHKLYEKGWIRWISIHDNGHLVIPEASKEPHTRPRRKLREGEHITRPWWGTKTTWWPSPTKEQTKAFRQEFLCDRDKHFRSSYAAGRCLEKFARWLQIEEAIVDKFRR
jgi:hypothetical protein